MTIGDEKPQCKSLDHRTRFKHEVRPTVNYSQNVLKRSQMFAAAFGRFCNVLYGYKKSKTHGIKGHVRNILIYLQRTDMAIYRTMTLPRPLENKIQIECNKK